MPGFARRWGRRPAAPPTAAARAAASRSGRFCECERTIAHRREESHEIGARGGLRRIDMSLRLGRDRLRGDDNTDEQREYERRHTASETFHDAFPLCLYLRFGL